MGCRLAAKYLYLWRRHYIKIRKRVYSTRLRIVVEETGAVWTTRIYVHGIALYFA